VLIVTETMMMIIKVEGEENFMVRVAVGSGGGTNYDGNYLVEVATVEMTIIVETMCEWAEEREKSSW